MIGQIVQRHLRRQKAEFRARRIRGFRKGKPKLGCYRCGYDCYELEGDRCTECNAPIDRGAPWWRDGKHNLAFPVVVSLLIAAAVIVLHSQRDRWVLGASAPVLLFVAVPVLATFAVCRTRITSSGVWRAYVALGPILLALILLGVFGWTTSP